MPRVQFVVDGITAEGADGEKLVDICERELVSIPFGCKDGNCGTCLSKVIGAVDPPKDGERSTLAIYGATEEHRLVCQCIVRGDLIVDDP